MGPADKFYLGAHVLGAMGSIHIPKNLLTSSFEDGRHSGSGGGGASFRTGGLTPFFCKSCGKTVSRKKVKPSCDVCSRCRSRGK
jgi:hypothetical protein